MNVHLVDGTYELYRAFFGVPSAKDANGREVGATRGLLRTLHALIRQDDVTHVAVAFDHVIESFRNKLFDGYKTGEGVEPTLWEQFELAETATAALGLTVWSMTEFEADDALAAGAVRFAALPSVDKVFVCTPDKDLAQVVSDPKIVTFDRARQVVRDEAGVREKFGVDPQSIPDWLGLVGDTADGIPGIPRWGAKSAATVLAHYKHIENIPDSDTDWTIKVRGAKSLAALLKEHREKAMLYRQLAVLRLDVPLTETLDDLAWHGAHKEKLTAVCAEIGERHLPDRINHWR